MSRINTNIASLQAIHRLNKNNGDLTTRLQRLSTGLRINTGKDAPAGLIASETLRSEIAGINQAIDNSQRANNVINTAEGALSEISALLLEVQSLTNEAANEGALSDAEVRANQLQVDAILDSIDRIANTTQFNGVKLLDGSLDYRLSSVASSAIDVVKVNAAKLPDNGFMTVTVEVVASAQLGQVNFTGAGIGPNAVTISVQGNAGVEQISLAASAATSAIAFAVNQLRDATGVSAVASAGGVQFYSTSFGSKQFVTVKAVAGTFTTDAETDFGENAQVNLNGQQAQVDGIVASLRNSSLDLSVTLDAGFAQTTGSTTSFQITGGGSKFQIGSQVNRNGQINIGINSVSAATLGNKIVGFLSSLRNNGENSLVSGNTLQAQKVISDAVSQIATIRGRLGALQKNVLETNISSLSVALENVTASESAIRDADFAAETAALTRAQILVQANTSILSQANSSPQNVLALLQ
jgi:flagellin